MKRGSRRGHERGRSPITMPDPSVDAAFLELGAVLAEIARDSQRANPNEANRNELGTDDDGGLQHVDAK